MLTQLEALAAGYTLDHSTGRARKGADRVSFRYETAEELEADGWTVDRSSGRWTATRGSEGPIQVHTPGRR